MRKESLQVVRDPSNVVIAFVLPVVLLFLFGFALSLDVRGVEVGVVVESDGAPARELAAAFAATRYFDARFARDRRELEPLLVAGRLRGIVVIPQDFAERLAAGRSANVQVLTDGSSPNTASFVANYARGVVATAFASSRTDAAPADAGLVSMEPRFWYNPDLESRAFIVPGAIAIVMTMIGTMLTALVVAREWERGTMEAMMATPVGIGEFLIGKLLPYFGLGLGATLVCAIAAEAWLGVPLRGSVPALLALSAAFLMPALGLGLLISAATKNQFVASQLALFSGFLPAFLLSGFLFEIDSMPEPIQWLTRIVAARYYVAGLQTLFLTGDVWPELVRSIGPMLGLGAGFFSLAAMNTRKRLE
ncbi:MAG TPA: ABC transporter permease [Gammaproteobacteria bacterium]